ncbi:MAG: GMP synthase [Coxiella sp. DG_40]|nr:MAG: GMP synthase [Coxiella sp. DG_40]
MRDIHKQSILILDFGSQYTQLIARRVREENVYCEIYPYDIPESVIKDFAPKGIILSGGPQTVTLEKTPRAPEIIFNLGCPLLGICYGMQTMAVQLGGKVQSVTKREFGYASVEIHSHSKLLTNIEDYTKKSQAFLDVWMSHGDKVTKLPKGFNVIASTANAPYAGIADETRKFYGLQFHPEVTHTKQGQRIIARFIHDICGCKKLWTPTNIVNDTVQNITQQVGNNEVLLGVSGGIDSSVTALLLHKAIEDRLTCLFIDTGLLRLNETEQVMNTFAKHFGIKIIHINAEKQFFKELAGITNPEQKRKIIGRQFIRVFEKEAKKIKNIKWLAQGTIYPDVIESAQTKFSKAQVIKSHHNVGGLPKKMHLKLIEPVRELFKDEVRKLAIELSIPQEVIHRHPFPGPGLGVRIIGEVKKEYADLLRLVDNIFLEELHNENLYQKISQAFAVFLPIKSVGVMGDIRKYEYVVALRAVETVDFMTANWVHLPHEFLEKVSNRIINEVDGISRVVYDISSKPPATIEWE